ncbi:uncharacterized protein LOC114240556 [Bombyx mandarina]|uniref:Uncharacterized protein LOC114240556 n=1 Tax=Bombyx mandarina TaxID=7092 RepID=A0A6J2JCW6_BOMMA|nr:uncharacterized protein LOC114240556 [Bombyx mandarina]
MDHTYRFLQGNLNHSAGAQDMLLQTMAEWSIDVAVVAEPYFVPPADDCWFGDVDGLAAIHIRRSAMIPPLAMVTRGPGIVAVQLENTVVIGVYFSPNRPTVEFERFLDGLEVIARHLSPRSVILAGDFNAKSVSWGSPSTDARGRLLEEWAVAADLCIVNRGSVATCVRWTGESIVDLTFASSSVAQRILGWGVVSAINEHAEKIRNKKTASWPLYPQSANTIERYTPLHAAA